jgi:O-antigen ligase
MICDAPLLGLGLGTFQDAYPLYSNNVVPLIVDKAHNDYLEFAAGVGLPAAIAWWTAVVWLVVKCVRGAFKRRLDKHYAILGVATSVLVGTHSALDFSLQIPAVALTFATLLGMGVAQSMPRQIKRV